jgi:hypothetical protein
MGGLAAAAPLAGLVLGGPVGMLIGLGGAAAATLLRDAQHQSELSELLKPTCIAVGPAVAYRGWQDGGHRFTFVNREYAHQFLDENQSRITI